MKYRHNVYLATDSGKPEFKDVVTIACAVIYLTSVDTLTTFILTKNITPSFR